jgi:hypothetical protein
MTAKNDTPTRDSLYWLASAQVTDHEECDTILTAATSVEDAEYLATLPITDLIAEADNRAEIGRLRAQLRDELKKAHAALTAAAGAATQLSSDAVYDVEYAEGAGSDIERWLRDAARMVRAAEALRKVTP